MEAHGPDCPFRLGDCGVNVFVLCLVLDRKQCFQVASRPLAHVSCLFDERDCLLVIVAGGVSA